MKKTTLFFLFAGLLSGCIQNPTKAPAVDRFEPSKVTPPVTDETAIILRNQGEKLLAEGRDKDAEIKFVKAAKLGDTGADARLAAHSLTGTFQYYSYETALSKLRKYRHVDPYAARAYVLQWLADIAHPKHKKSLTNAYLAARDYETTWPKGDPLDILPGPTVIEAKSRALNGLFWSFKKSQDPMTDRVSCLLASDSTNGVNIGINNVGIFVLSETPLSDDHSFMGLRVDQGHFYTAIPSEEWLKQKKAKDALISLVVSKSINVDQFERMLAESKQRYKPANYFYAVRTDDPSFREVIGAMASADSVMVRTKGADGTVKLSEYALSPFIPELEAQVPVFDAWGYLFLACLDGS